MQSKSKNQAFWMIKNLNQAINQFKMIRDGDRIGVAVSGGKDSLSLLKLLDIRRSSSKENYELVAIHVSGDSLGPRSPTHLPLTNWLEKSGYPYITEEFNLSKHEEIPMNCYRCSWNRKKQIFEIAQRMECNVVAFGHHSDDLAQTTLLNLVFHGRVETMPPVSEYFNGFFRLIRPLCYISEKDIQKFSRAIEFPPPPPECSRNEFSQRKIVKNFLEVTQKKFPYIQQNLIRAGLRKSNKSFDKS